MNINQLIVHAQHCTSNAIYTPDGDYYSCDYKERKAFLENLLTHHQIYYLNDLSITIKVPLEEDIDDLLARTGYYEEWEPDCKFTTIQEFKEWIEQNC